MRENGVWFQSPIPVFCRMKNDFTFSEFKKKIERKVREGHFPRHVTVIVYCKPNTGDDSRIHYSTIDIQSDDNVDTMMETNSQFVRVGPLELYVNTIRTSKEIIFFLRQGL